MKGLLRDFKKRLACCPSSPRDVLVSGCDAQILLERMTPPLGKAEPGESQGRGARALTYRAEHVLSSGLCVTGHEKCPC